MTVPAAPKEIEAKFSVPSPALVAPLYTAAQLDSGHPLAAAYEVGMVDTYLDTADYRLLRHGYGLRIRTVTGKPSGDERLATLKSRRLADATLGGLFQRLEIEESLAAEATTDPVRGWPEAILQVVLPLLDGKERLQPICELRQVRTKRNILAPSNGTTPSIGTVPRRRSAAPEVVGELSLDHITVHGGPAEPALAQFDELEVELARGRAEGELETIIAALAGSLKLAPSSASKLEHALQIAARPPAVGSAAAAADPAGQPALHPALPMAEACRLIWREQLTAMLLNEAGVRYSDDPEYVHDMRVATRRARAAAKLYGDYFRPKAVKRYLAGLRRTARLLGAVRDLDVAIGKLARFERRSRKRSKVANPVLQETLAAWRSRRTAAHAALVAWFDSAVYAKFVVRFAVFCRTPGAGARSVKPKPGAAPTPYQVRHVAPSMVLNRFESVRCFEALFDAAKPGEPPAGDMPGDEGAHGVPVEVLHQLRIECKYLRYNLEFVESLLGPQATHLIGDLRKLQQDLGDLNDAAVSKRLIADLHGLEGPAVDRYLREQDRTIRRLSARVPADLRTFVSHLNRRRLALAIAWL